MMNKTINIILLLAVVYSTIGCNKSENYLEKNNIKGQVESIRIKEYSAKEAFGEVQKDSKYSWRDELIEVNNQGDIVTITNFYDDEISSKLIYKYDNNGLLTDISSYNKEGNIDGKEVYYYTKDQVDSVYVYNNDGYRIKRFYYYRDEKDRIDSIRVYEVLNYDDLKTETDEYMAAGTDSAVVDSCPTGIIGYDSIPNTITENLTEKEKILVEEKIEIIVRTYLDENDSYRETIESGNEKEVSVYYFNKDKRIEKIQTKSEIIEFEYNKNGDLSKYVEKDIIKDRQRYNVVREYEYEYDKEGNWIRQIIFEGEDKKPEMIIEREINYFK